MREAPLLGHLNPSRGLRAGVLCTALVAAAAVALPMSSAAATTGSASLTCSDGSRQTWNPGYNVNDDAYITVTAEGAAGTSTTSGSAGKGARVVANFIIHGDAVLNVTLACGGTGGLHSGASGGDGGSSGENGAAGGGSSGVSDYYGVVLVEAGGGGGGGGGICTARTGGGDGGNGSQNGGNGGGGGGAQGGGGGTGGALSASSGGGGGDGGPFGSSCSGGGGGGGAGDHGGKGGGGGANGSAGGGGGGGASVTRADGAFSQLTGATYGTASQESIGSVTFAVTKVAVGVRAYPAIVSYPGAVSHDFPNSDATDRYVTVVDGQPLTFTVGVSGKPQPTAQIDTAAYLIPGVPPAPYASTPVDDLATQVSIDFVLPTETFYTFTTRPLTLADNHSPLVYPNGNLVLFPSFTNDLGNTGFNLQVLVVPKTSPVTVSATQTYGDSAPVYTYTSDPAHPVTGTVTCTGDEDGLAIYPGLAPGSYTVDSSTCSGLTPADPDAPIVYSDGPFTVSPAPLTITASSTTTTYGGAPAVTASYSGFVNGEGPSALTAAPTCVSTVTATTHAGTSGTNSCSGASSDDYAISYVAGTVSVGKRTLSVSTTSTNTTYGDPPAAATPLYSGFVNGEGPDVLDTPATCTNPVTASTHVGSYSITCSGLVDADYVASYTNGSAVVGSAALTVTASSATITYGSAPPAITASYSGFASGEGPSALTTKPTCSTTATAASHVGTYPATCLGAVDSDYTITTVAGVVRVTPAPLTVTASSPTSIYGANPPAVTASYSGFVNGDGPSSLTTKPTCTTTATAASHVGSYTTSCSGTSDADYLVTHVNGSLTVSPAALTVTASSATSTYGATPPAVAPAYTGFVNHDNASSLTTAPTCSTTATAASHVGSYPTTCTGAADADYTITRVPGTLTVTPAPLTVRATDATRTYGDANPTFGYTTSGYVNGDTASAVSGAPSLATTATAASPAGTYPITVTRGTLAAADYSFVLVPGTLTVAKAATRTTAERAIVFPLVAGAFGQVAARVVYGSADKPVVGQVVTFTAGSTVLCRGTTDATGRASCALTLFDDIALILRLHYVATFAGSDSLIGSSDSAGIGL